MCDSPHQTSDFEILNLNLKKKIEILCPMGKCKISNILEMDSRRAKQSEI